ncbi:dTDP-4-dehydrorhamnose 3,5-epimerase family protein [Patescibacteria group bacterium]|nr:dTDP-4-dehydrorhamnose 3,5-epimerase family protein [Patescibacteria group bacterium]
MIEGVKIKELVVHKDERGFFYELIRASDTFFGNFAQLSHSMAHKGVLKAWHLHKKQTDWMYVATGKIKLALYDNREGSKTKGELVEMVLGEGLGRKVVKIPPGVAHGYKVLNGPMHIMYVMDREYDPDDELRIPHDDPEIGYDWSST